MPTSALCRAAHNKYRKVKCCPLGPREHFFSSLLHLIHLTPPRQKHSFAGTGLGTSPRLRQTHKVKPSWFPEAVPILKTSRQERGGGRRGGVAAGVWVSNRPCQLSPSFSLLVWALPLPPTSNLGEESLTCSPASGTSSRLHVSTWGSSSPGPLFREDPADFWSS